MFLLNISSVDCLKASLNHAAVQLLTPLSSALTTTRASASHCTIAPLLSQLMLRWALLPHRLTPSLHLYLCLSLKCSHQLWSPTVIHNPHWQLPTLHCSTLLYNYWINTFKIIPFWLQLTPIHRKRNLTKFYQFTTFLISQWNESWNTGGTSANILREKNILDNP